MRRSLLSARRQRGLTLIELMVSLLIGFAVVGALLAAYMASFRSSAHNDAMVQVTEDAALALNVIRTQVAMAGYTSVVNIDPASQTMIGHAALQSSPIFGCADAGFASNQHGMAASTCTGASTSDTIEVAYEALDKNASAGSSNAILDATGVPLDCVGSALAKTTKPSEPDYYAADSKFYVSNDKLYCEGPQDTAAGAPLVDNVELLSIKYGLAEASSKQIGRQIIAYVPAPAKGHTDWQRVVSVSICVVVHSAVAVNDKTPVNTKNALDTYVDCSGNIAHSTDGKLRRSFSTTVLLQNMFI
jgi:type IV pilus assembly protein PilW